MSALLFNMRQKLMGNRRRLYPKIYGISFLGEFSDLRPFIRRGTNSVNRISKQEIHLSHKRLKEKTVAQPSNFEEIQTIKQDSYFPSSVNFPDRLLLHSINEQREIFPRATMRLNFSADEERNAEQFWSNIYRNSISMERKIPTKLS